MLRDTFLRRDDAHRWARQAKTRVDQGLAPNKSSVSRLQTFGNLIDVHITELCEVGKARSLSSERWLKRALGAAQKRGRSKWHFDEVVVPINGHKHRIWRAVDANGDVLGILVQSRRNKAAAVRF